MPSQGLECPRCSRRIDPDDSVVNLRDGRVSHLDCRMPRVLSADERAVLIFYCFDHPVGECLRCRRQFRETALATDYLSGRTHLCPLCGDDLTDSVRTHLYGCAMAPEMVRRKAQMARETARRLVKESRQLQDDADLLSREAEALLDSARETVQRNAKKLPLLPATYRGWRIEPQSFAWASDRWCPKASVKTLGGGNVHTQIVLSRTFATRHDADAFAVAMAKDLIDDMLA